MRATKPAIIAGLLAMLAGCASKPADIVIQENTTPVVCSQAPRPDAIDLTDTPPRVVFDAETEQWGYWFSPASYADLAENLQAMRRYQRQQRAVGAYFLGCIDDHNRRLAEIEPGD